LCRRATPKYCVETKIGTPKDLERKRQTKWQVKERSVRTRGNNCMDELYGQEDLYGSIKHVRQQQQKNYIVQTSD
jgi:hypothetical protein